MLTAWDSSGQQSSYTYDFDGRRVRRKVGVQAELWYVYDVDGALVAEYTANVAPTSPQIEYGYRNGEMLVTAQSSANVQWMVTDQLGTPRMIADRTGSLGGIKRHDYLPFGEELFAGSGLRTTGQGYVADNVRQKFTQKERDMETGLDYFGARYYSSAQGRFTGVDSREIPFEANSTKFVAYLGNPQNWNHYSYVLNNPMVVTDPNGREPNKEQAGTAQQIIAIIQQTERDNPNASPREILQRVDGFFRAQSAGAGAGNTRYVYTEEKGWIDFRHFFAAANQAADYGEVITDALGTAVEVKQTIERSTSAFSYEDIPSNGTGSDFGDDYFDPSGGLLSDQVSGYLNNLRPTAPTAAPNYSSLPNVEDAGSRTNQSAGSRTLDSSTTSRQGGGGQGQSSGTPQGTNSSGTAQGNRRVSSSGNQRRPH
jgi:RHS repeat-associated protein